MNRETVSGTSSLASSRMVSWVERMNQLTRKWWFVALFIVLGTMVPPIVSKGTVEPQRIGEVITQIMANALINAWASWYPLFKIIPLVLIGGLVFAGNRMGRIFSLYVAISHILFAVLQGMAVLDQYGFAIVTGNVLSMLIVSGFWFWEASLGRNDFSRRTVPAAKYWVLPLALLAFWYPIDLTTMRLNFNPAYLLTNSAGLTYCMMTPVYLSVLILYYPKVNIPTFRVTSLLGVLIAFWNVVTDFFMQPDLIFMGILHIPLVVISIYGLILSYRARAKKPAS